MMRRTIRQRVEARDVRHENLPATKCSGGILPPSPMHHTAAGYHRYGKFSSTPCLERRRGISLLEIVLSVAIFMLGFAGIVNSLEIGRRAEVGARLQSEAVVRCESVMGEILCGATEPSSSDGNRFEDDEIGNWSWSATVTDAGTTNLLQVTVLVEHRPGGAEPNASFSLVRFMRDPQIFLDAALEESE